MPLRRKHHLEGGGGSSSKEGSPVLRRRQAQGKASAEDSSSIETDEDFEKLSSEDFAEGKTPKTTGPPATKPYQNPRGSNFDDLTDKDIYEMQLKNLQSQLEAAVIEKTSLVQQLKYYEEVKDMARFKNEMDRIKEENTALRDHCRDVENRLSQARMSQSQNRSENRIALESEETETPTDTTPAHFPRVRGRYEEWKVSTLEKLLDLLSDFSDEPDDEKVEEDDEGEEFSVKRLKANINRFKASYKPIVSYIKAVTILLSWQSPSTTFLAFCIYMYCAWRGWLISLMLGLTIWLLGSTYFISRGWKISFSLLPYDLIEEPVEDNQSTSITDKYKLVIHIARKVQNYLGLIADQLEKLYNMIYWGNLGATAKLIKGVWVAFIASLIFSESWMMFFSAVAIGFKLFILNALYNRFPRFKAKYDSVHLFFKSLPTHADLEEKRLAQERSEYVTFPPIVDTEVYRTGSGETTLAFSETFNLPPSEYPLPGWEEGKRCTIINKERYLSAAFRHGRLYLTNCNLVFGTSRIHHKKRDIIINLKDIISVEKAKPFLFIPGQGMSVQITIFREEKPLMFSGIIGRDDVLRDIQRAVEEAGIRAASETNSGGNTSANSNGEASIGTD